jgi:glucose/arabinose dehydrogenase
MPVPVTPASPGDLQRLPTPGRPRVDAADVVVPDGYQVEVLVVGLSFPTGMGFAEDGTLFILEGGSVWPTRPYLPARVLRLHPDGTLDSFTEEEIGGPRGVAVRDGHVYVSSKGGYHARVTRYDQETGRDGTVIVDGLPDGGWHEPGGPLFGPDGLMYFAQGSVSQNGIVQPHAFIVDLARHPRACDVPGQDVTLTGNNIDTVDPRPPYPYMVTTGAFKPFGVDAEPGEVVKGRLKCSSGIWRAQPDGSEMELIAWGVRNPYGMVFGEDGHLYVSDNDMEETGERAVKGDPDRIWRLDAAKRPHGQIDTPAGTGSRTSAPTDCRCGTTPICPTRAGRRCS